MMERIGLTFSINELEIIERTQCIRFVSLATQLHHSMGFDNFLKLNWH